VVGGTRGYPKLFESEKIIVLVQLASKLALIARRIVQVSVMKIDVSIGNLWVMFKFRLGEKTPTTDDVSLLNLESSV